MKRKYSVGQAILNKMVETKYNKNELSVLLSLDVRTLKKLLNNEVKVTSTLATKLAIAFNTSIEYWLRLDTMV